MDALLTFLRQDPQSPSSSSSEENASDKALRRQIQHALDLISSLLTLFPLEHLALTFNGGKDACVVFYLVRAALALRGVTGKEELARVKCLYFAPKHGEFPEVTSFMQEVAATFDFSYTVYPPGCSYQEGMRDLVEREGLKAVFLGVRSGDPYSLESEHLQPSSPGWPVFLRVNPILKWDYGLVWRFLRGFNLPYCSLYEEGYTSLGDIRTTIRNPALLKEGKEGGRGGGKEEEEEEERERYRPAYELVDWTLERANRAVVGEGGREGGREKEKEKEAATTTTKVVGEEGVGNGKRKEEASSTPLSTPLVGKEEEEEEEGVREAEGEVDDRSQGRQQQQQQQQQHSSLSPPRHVRRRSSFAERLPVALLCVGDFLSVRDSAPMALAHELRELRCRVAPIVITPCSSALEEGGREGGKEGEEEEGREEEMFSLARFVGAGARSRSPLFVLCVDEETHAEVRQRLSALLGHEQQAQSSSSSSNNNKGQDETATIVAAAHDKAGDGEEEGEREGGDGAEGTWQASSAHVEKSRHVYLLSPHFLHHVSIESQKAEFAALLDSISEPSKESAADAASVLCRVLPERTSRSSNSNSNISRVVG